MKLTLIKTEKSGRQRISTCTVTQLAERMKATAKDNSYEVYPGIEMRRRKSTSTTTPDSTGERMCVVRNINGVVVLTVNHLTPQEQTTVKQAAMTLPTTLMATASADGQGAVVLVRYCTTSGVMADMQATAAYQQALTVYGQLLGHPIERVEAQVRMHFNLPHDPQPLLNVDAVALPQEQNGQETLRLIDFLSSHFDFRFNTVMGYTEYRSKTATKDAPWAPADDRTVNSLTMVTRIAGINAWDKDIRRYMESDLVNCYNPIADFLSQARNSWDGTTDHIGLLARRVPCRQELWEGWFRKWFVYMVAQWLGATHSYGNATAPLFISRQGYNKSTFCRMLLPDSLQWGYNDNLLIAEKKATLQAMSQMLLINLDEFNQISPAIQSGFLKNVIQLPRIKLKRPFSMRIEEFPRLASFVATTNMADALVDPSGNRRFIAVELTGPIDVSTPINYLGLYGQAVALVEQGYEYWLTQDEVKQLMDHNRQYQQQTPAEQWFSECFDVATDEQDGQWLTCAAIYKHLRHTVGTTFGGNLNLFGRALCNMPGMHQKRSNLGKLYLVRQRQ